MPKYENFNKKICNLAEIFKKIAEFLLNEQEIDYENMLYLLDSMPVMVANNSRSSSAKVAKDMCNCRTQFDLSNVPLKTHITMV